MGFFTRASPKRIYAYLFVNAEDAVVVYTREKDEIEIGLAMRVVCYIYIKISALDI